MKLALAFALLLVASIARADGVETNQGPVYIPNGSTITSEQSIPDPWGESAGPGLPSGLPATLLDFTFADGSGQIITAGIYGELGSIDFATPVAGLTISWVGDYFWLADNVGDSFGYPNNNSSSGTSYWSGPGILVVNFGSGVGSAGVNSMTYALDGPASVPEAPLWLMLVLGVGACLLIAGIHTWLGNRSCKALFCTCIGKQRMCHYCTLNDTGRG
jgi:hypothetical protein